MSYTINPQLRNLNTDFTSCLFGSVKLTKNAKNADIDKYKYSSYGIGFDSRLEFPFADGSFVIIFWKSVSSNINEVIRPVSNFFFFFTIRFHKH